jgi:hypothetical protein
MSSHPYDGLFLQLQQFWTGRCICIYNQLDIWFPAICNITETVEKNFSRIYHSIYHWKVIAKISHKKISWFLCGRGSGQKLDVAPATPKWCGSLRLRLRQRNTILTNKYACIAGHKQSRNLVVDEQDDYKSVHGIYIYSKIPIEFTSIRWMFCMHFIYMFKVVTIWLSVNVLILTTVCF